MLADVVAIGQLALKERVVRGVERGHMPLHAVQYVVVAVAARRGLDRVDVRARALLGDRVALAPLAARRRLDVTLYLVGSGDGRQPGRGRRDHPGQRVGDASDLFLDQHLLHRGAAAATELLGQVRCEQAELDSPRGVLGFLVGRQFAARQLDAGLQGDQLVGEQARPGLDLKVLL